MDPLLAEEHAALGIAYAREGQWKHSETSFHRSIELDPNRSGSYCHVVSYVLLVLGRLDEALQQLHVAEKGQPALTRGSQPTRLRAPFGRPLR